MRSLRARDLVLPLLVSGGVVALACTSVTGIDDLKPVECVEEPCVDGYDDAGSSSSSSSSSSSGATSSSSSSGSSGVTDGGTDGGGGNRPSYCMGIIFYAPFEGNTTARGGQAGENDDVGFVAGKFGQAVNWGNGSGNDWSVRWANPGPNGAIHDGNVGSVLVWVKPENVGGLRTVLRPQTNDDTVGNSDSQLAGPAISVSENRARVRFDSNAEAEATNAIPGWSTSAFNMLVATWDKNTRVTLTAVTSPTQTTRIVQTRSFSPRTLDGDARVRLGDSSIDPRLAVDDLTIWNRELTEAEIAAIFAAPASIGDTCP